MITKLVTGDGGCGGGSHSLGGKSLIILGRTKLDTASAVSGRGLSVLLEARQGRSRLRGGLVLEIAWADKAAKEEPDGGEKVHKSWGHPVPLLIWDIVEAGKGQAVHQAVPAKPRNTSVPLISVSSTLKRGIPSF